MATQRLSRLHTRILRWLAADHHRSKGFISSSHEELVQALYDDHLSRGLSHAGSPRARADYSHRLSTLHHQK